eukprot:TRINITY_DN21894_c0_g1_i1.p1 TRINITY_DN21894_c0_g1~~TRINITY_DN21894_c0_g1_i1.p1  ORF type:complete len:166 (+),score=16.74 TRINITY_DN21894_c0_g1_i1:177-674(+)
MDAFSAAASPLGASSPAPDVNPMHLMIAEQQDEYEGQMSGIVPVRAAQSCVVGFGLGMVFSIFGSAMTPMGGYLSDNLGIKETFKRIGSDAVRHGRNFAIIGFYFAVLDLVLEKRRGRHDIWNPLITAYIVGAGMARHRGLSAMMWAGTGFAAFSGIIELVTHRH